MIQYDIDLQAYINEVKIVIEDTTYFFDIKKNSANNGCNVEIKDINGAYLFSQPIYDGEGMFDRMNILDLQNPLYYILNLDENSLIIWYLD